MQHLYIKMQHYLTDTEQQFTPRPIIATPDYFNIISFHANITRKVNTSRKHFSVGEKGEKKQYLC